jgi:hypothetical protein
MVDGLMVGLTRIVFWVLHIDFGPVPGPKSHALTFNSRRQTIGEE